MVADYKFDFSNPLLYANDHFKRLLLDRNRYIISYGGRDSGKSYNFSQKMIYDCIAEPYYKGVLLRRIYADIRDSQYETILETIADWNLEDMFYCTTNPLKINCLLNDNVIIARGLDKPSKLKSIKDPNVIWIEEADEITLKGFEKSDLSIRSNRKEALLQMLISFNPEDEECWVNDEFFPPSKSYQKEDGNFSFIESILPDTTILHSSYKTNRYCNPQNVKRYDNIKFLNKKRYDVALMGLWGGAKEGLVFKNNIFYKDEFPTEENRSCYGIGLDFGFTNDPTAIVEACIAHGEIWARELCYETGLVNTTNLRDRRPIEKKLHSVGVTENDRIHGDKAEPKSIQELEDVGFYLDCPDKPPGSRVASYDKLLSYNINVVGSENLKKEFKGLEYVKTKEGKNTNEPEKVMDHAIDALRYWSMKQLNHISDIGFTIV